MNIDDLYKRMEAAEARLDALEGGNEVEAPIPEPKAKKASGEFPKWIYRRGDDGEPQAMLVQTKAELPDVYAESPADLEESAVEPNGDGPKAEELEDETEDEQDVADSDLTVEIPDDWREMHHSTRIKLAKTLPGGDDITAAEDADAMIELELERRGDA